MQWIGSLFLSAPLVCIVVLVFVAFLQGISSSGNANSAGKKRKRGAAVALGAAFLCFSMFYRPRLELAVAAQVQQEEQDDTDDKGNAESPVKHLLRQLRRIRRGEPVDHLVWRLE